MYDVIIIGGGPAGLACAMTLGSVRGSKGMPQDKTVLVIDKGGSQLNLTELHNVPGIPRGKSGKELLAELKIQTVSFGGVEIVENSVTSISGTKGEFTVRTANVEYHAKTLVLATGLVKYEIDGLGIKTVPNDRVPKPNLIRLDVPANGQIVDGVYVAGLLAGEPTMYTIAAGSGVKVACAITSEWMGQIAVVHDVKGSRSST